MMLDLFSTIQCTFKLRETLSDFSQSQEGQLREVVRNAAHFGNLIEERSQNHFIRHRVQRAISGGAGGCTFL